MKLFFGEYKFHVMNMSSGRFIHHTDDEQEAIAKAKYFAGTSGCNHQVMESRFIATQERNVKVTEFN